MIEKEVRNQISIVIQNRKPGHKRIKKLKLR